MTLNSVTRGDVCDALRNEVDDSDVRQSLSSWPSAAPVLIETIGQTLDESQQPKSRYTWISEVGAGGLGKVWLARDNDLAREVALKEIKPGSASSEAVRRLIKEAQITGQLQHPGIVPVYEVNREGRPFYTMKLVKGETLSHAIREHHEQKQAGQADAITERRLLSIFLSICDAIAYAHSRGVIHRDLKPENVVLGEYGEAIVLDWGLARQVSSEDEDSAPIVVTEDGRTDATQAGRKVGTPSYMSPEQAAGRVEHMDERTDIYGLGAILFEILTGQPPHSSHHAPRDEPSDPAASIDSSPLNEESPSPEHSAHHAERDGYLEPPSDEPLIVSPVAALLHRIATGETPRVRSLDETIPDELDAICATAMARHRDERYQTAKDLKAALLEFQVHEESIELAARAADDLEAARQCGTYDDFSRARFGFETALQQWPENARASDGLKETRHDYADAAFNRGDYDLALSLLDAADPDQADLALVKTIQAATKERDSRAGRIRRLRRFGLAASLSVAIVASVAAVWIYAERQAAVRARTLAETRADEARVATEQAEAAAETARTQTSLALDTLNTVIFDIQRGLENVPGAGAVRRRLLNTALESLQQIAGEFAETGTADRQTMVAMMALADVFLRVGQGEDGDASRSGPLEAARDLYRQANDIAKTLAAADPTDARAQHDLSVSYNKLGNVSRQTGQVTEALGFYQQSLDIAKTLAAADPTDTQAQRDLSFSYEKLGDVSLQTGQVTEALGFFQQSLDIRKTLAAADPTDALAQRDLSVSYSKLGNVSRQTGQVSEALGFYQQSLDISKTLAAADPTDAQALRDLSISYERLGDVSRRTGQVTEALGFYQQALDIHQTLTAADPTDAQAQRDLIISHAKFGLTHRQLLDYAASVSSFESGLKIATAVQQRDLLKGNIEPLIQSLKRDLATSRTLLTATGDWETVLELAKKSPVLLYHRAAEFAKQRKWDQAAQAAAKFREIAQAADDGKADHLYNAARAYGLCAAALQPAEDQPLSEEQQTRRREYVDLSLTCLKEAITAGYDNFAHARKDSDLAALRELPEFQKLVKSPLEDAK